MRQSGHILTESQLVALEKAKEAKVAKGEIETHHPGYLGSQDTYYVGTIKDIGEVFKFKKPAQKLDMDYVFPLFSACYRIQTALNA